MTRLGKVAAILLLIVILLPMSYFGTSEPVFCRSCHYIDPYVDSWASSSHQEVKCLFCHEARGPFGKVNSKSRGLNYVAMHITGNYTTAIKGWADERNCIACHLNDVTKYPDAPNLKEIPGHLDYIAPPTQEGALCISCHAETGHALGLGLD
ncbi:MAG: NapC/NirT family cytochrome c [Bacillota bacterium]|nr:NapC/NirT family cytochrome c [Bacillota bacterium]